jgi:hypothetical protein
MPSGSPTRSRPRSTATTARPGSSCSRRWAQTGTFRDPQANVAGRAALDAHIANARRFAAGANLVRGAVVVSHRELLWPWRIEGADGAVWAAGTNHAVVDPDGRIAAMTGFWDVGGGR